MYVWLNKKKLLREIVVSLSVLWPRLLVPAQPRAVEGSIAPWRRGVAN